jgi:hypothetical protein
VAPVLLSLRVRPRRIQKGEAMHRTALAFAALIAPLAAAAPAHAAGLLAPVDGSRPPLAIQDHRVTVTLDNGFAITEVDQVFHNPHDVDLDAVYTFPLPRHATLSELSLWLDGEEIIGEVVEKQRGRRISAKERAAGRETALAEQRSYVAFDVAVSPVRAGSVTRVRLVYLQPVELDTGVGRYVYPLDEGGIDTEMQSFWNRTERVDGSFRFEATLRSAYPLDAVRVADTKTRACSSSRTARGPCTSSRPRVLRSRRTSSSTTAWSRAYRRASISSPTVQARSGARSWSW